MKLIGEGQALAAFWIALGAVESVVKGEEADMGKYTVRYASLNAVYRECQRACEDNKLSILQEPTVIDGLFAVINTLIHEDGSMIELAPMQLPLPKDAQALGSATTYLRRYSLVSQFGLAVEDDDGRAATVAAQAAPGRRTEAERLIRETVARMTPEQRVTFQADFVAEFKSTLTDLPANRHGAALTWSRTWEAAWVPPGTEPSVADEMTAQAEEYANSRGTEGAQ